MKSLTPKGFRKSAIKRVFFHMIFVPLLFSSVYYAESADDSFYLNFPLSDYNPYDAPISSVFDHSITTPYLEDNVVVVYTGEMGDYQNYSATCDCYSSSDGQPFSVNGNYTGASSCGGAYYLCYDGHPSTDYAVVNNTPVYAAADGIAYLPSSFPGVSNAQDFNTIEIDHQNGYKTYYLHLSNRVVSDGQTVTRDQVIGYSGDIGSPGAYHLHFEVQKNGIPVDPYGWEGSGSDPYTLASNINLWTSPTLPNKEFPISNTENSEGSPATASDGTNYLVIFMEVVNLTSYIYGQLVSPSGILLGSKFLIAEEPEEPESSIITFPQIAFDGTNYLVIWSYRNWEPDQSGIKAQFVSPSGNLIGSQINVAGPSGGYIPTPYGPCYLDFDGSNYLTISYDTWYKCFGQFISTSGTVSSEYELCQGSCVFSPNLAFDGNNYLVVFTSSSNLHGQFISPSGTKVGSSFVINQADDFQERPALSFDGTKYLVVWKDRRRQGYNYVCDIYGQIVSPDGTLIGDEIFCQESSHYLENRPAIAFNGVNYLVIAEKLVDEERATYWDGYDLCVCFISKDGTVINSNIPITTADGARDHPAIASDGTKFLVVWREGRNEYPNFDIYGRIISSTVPMADAGPDQTVDEGVTVMLDGSNSIDPDDGIASYQWTQTGGTSVMLSDASAAQPTFTAPDVGPDGKSLTFQLTVTDNGGLQSTDICIVNVTSTYYISGQVISGGTGLSGVTMTLSGASTDTTPTDPDGDYFFTGLANGSYTITPSLEGYTFNPASIDITISGSDVSGQDFRACDTSVPLSGILRDATTNNPLSGITVTVDGVYSTVTDSNGYYEFSGLSCGEHTINVEIPPGYSSYTRTMDTSEHQTWDILLTKPETVYGGETPSGYGPDPVNTATGNYIYKKKYLEILGRGMSSVFESHYNSQSDVDGPLGFGWGHTYNVKLTVNGDSTVTIRWADGKTETWAPDGSGGFTPQYGVFDDLIDNGDGTHTLKKKDLTEYNFNTSGRLSNIVDKNGNTVSMTYAGNNLTQITDTAGRNIDLACDGNGRITQITDPIGRTVQFAYDVNGNLVSATDMNGNATTYTYDSYHQLLTVVDPRGNTVVTNTYDDQKRVVTSQRDAKGGQTTYTYDEVNKKTTITDALGYTTVHFHDELLRLIQEIDDKSNSAYFTYDEPGNRTEVKDKNGNTTTYTYDANGNVLTKTDALGNVTTITYNENNNPLTRTDALGNTTTYEYDANGNLIKTTDPLGNVTTMTYNAHGQPLTITDARGNTTTNSYDAEGNLIEVTDAVGNKTTYTYDGVGRRLTATNALGKITAYTYDNNDNLLTLTDPLGNQTAHTYDENNNRLTTADPMGNTTNYSYDVKDLLTTISDPLANSITNAYDGLDRKTSVTDKRGNTTTFSYDGVGNLLTITDPLDNSATYTYDANGNQLTRTNPLGHTVTYAYNALDRVTSATDPLGNSTTTIYDAIGRVTAETNAKGQTTGFEYDAIGRLTKVTDDKGGTVISTYDENGNRLTMKGPNGNTTTYTYDALNRLTQKVEPLGGTYQYAYDAVRNMTSLTDADGNTITYTYDGNNRLTEITYPDNSIVTFTCNANGNRTQMVDNLGTTGYAYDALNRMASYTDPFGQTVAYGYDANGNRASLTYPDGKMVSYTYDAVNRLTTVTDWLINETIYTYDAAGNLVETLNPNNTKVTHTYDAAERLTGLSNTKSDSSVISSYTYTLDAVGNHANVVQNEPLAPILASQNITYTYDVENRLLEAGGTTYSYDTNGNLAGKGSDTFSYDYEDRLVQSNIEGADTQYSYDGLGNRLAKTAGSTTTRYVLDINGTLSNVLAETDNTGAVTAYYIYGLGLISKIFPDGTTYNYHYDSRGSTVALTDAVQNTTDAYAYDSFGNIVNSNGSSENPFKYVGRYGVMEEGNGLNYIRARYYSPEVGRFITKDPETGDDRDGQSLNRYVYALNNPVVLIDISGFSALEGGVKATNFASSDEYHEGILQLSELSFVTAGSTPAHTIPNDAFEIIEKEYRKERRRIYAGAGITILKASVEAAICIGGIYTGNLHLSYQAFGMLVEDLASEVAQSGLLTR